MYLKGNYAEIQNRHKFMFIKHCDILIGKRDELIKHIFRLQWLCFFPVEVHTMTDKDKDICKDMIGLCHTKGIEQVYFGHVVNDSYNISKKWVSVKKNLYMRQHHF